MRWALLTCRVIATASVLLTSACAPIAPQRQFIDITELPGWSVETAINARPALKAGCDRIATLPPQNVLANPAGGVPVSSWSEPCERIIQSRELAPAAFAEALQESLVAIIPPDGPARAFITGYYEPEFPASRTPDVLHRFPLLRLPNDPKSFDRAEIAAGALSGRGLEIVYLADPFDAFVIQVQGSGRVRLPDGSILRLGYAGDNGRQYVAIGRLLVEAGLIKKSEVSMQSIRKYLKEHPDQIDYWLNQNPRYIFFREIDGQGPIGAAGHVLAPMASAAVDPAFLALGQPLWLNATWPSDGGGRKAGDPLPVLAVALDTGGAIKGEGRFDLFWGAGDIAEEMAGRMRVEGKYFAIVPRAWAKRMFGAGAS